MTTPQDFPPSKWARAYVRNYGFSLVKLPPGKKFPAGDAWQLPENQIQDPAAAFDYWDERPDWGMGLCLGESRMCSLDVDNLEETRIVLSEFGIDVDAWADQYPTVVGNPARFRIEFRVPDGIELSTHQLQWPNPDNLKKRHVVFEVRAGSVQDVLPPTIHPDTGAPYTWRTKPTNNEIPTLPDELLVIWQHWDIFVQNARAICPWAVDVQRPAPPKTENPGDGTDMRSVIVRFNAAHDIETMLVEYGYKKVGKRFLSPHSQTKLPGVNILEGNRAWIHHASDPLGGEKPVNPFDLFCMYDHNNDVARAVRAAAKMLGIAHKTRAELAAERAQQSQRAPMLADGETVDDDTGEIMPAPSTQSYLTDNAGESSDRQMKPAKPDRPEYLDARLAEAKFRPLGYNSGTYYYLASGTQQITPLTASQHSKANLLQLERLAYWEREFKKQGRDGGIDVDDAMDSMMRECEYRGVFDASMLRGRGVWYDDGRIMVHLGDRVLVDGSPALPGRVPSRYVYEAKIPMRATVDQPLTATESKKYADLVAMASWEKPLYATLAAGWAVVAHIGGVLTWRPHIWIIGRRGSGKTHIVAKMLRPVMGDNVLHVQGHTSEAGIRQDLGVDSLPVLFDEAEGEDMKSNDRLQAVLALVRQSSSETGGKMLKGTTAGKSMQFQIRSCFAFSSITANLMQQSDKSRVTILELNQDYARHDFAAIVAAEADLLSDEYCQRFYARALRMAPVIRRNALVFSAAAAAVLGEQRAGDQLGALLAGAYSLESDDELTADQATAWIESRDWTEQREEAQGQSDELACWTHLLQSTIDVVSDRGREQMKVGELMDIATGRKLPSAASVARDYAETKLLHAGFRIMPDGATVAVSNGSPDIRRMLDGKPWQADWGRVLKRLPGAAASPGMVYFGFSGSEKRATMIPLTEG